ncbi:MAG: hypothetical protein K9J12_00260 [Melioribacteraceae bacterium]|nr:hypothetical protein [Melioribacteraceae bacterium]MCF8265019.1 hypothetical protein [Melioribacteraceae bacterium]MCF8413818.1 hypothetical protein [Melioribacteraceae bacterium]
MKINILFLMIVLPLIANAQRRGGDMPGEHLEAFEQSKLIEVLNLDEETAIRFFARRNSSMNEIKQIIEKRDDLLKSLKDDIQDDEVETGEKIISEVFKLEKEILNKRESFVRSLSDILDRKQILKLVFFDYKFKKEVKDILLDRRRRGPPPNRGFD